MFTSKITTKSIPKSGNDRLWQIHAHKETPDDDLKDMHSLKSSAPSRVPELITKASCSIIAACCGPILDDGRRWKRPILPVHIRRASDLALTSVFGFALDLDIWGSDPTACSRIMHEVTERYCSDDFNTEINSEIVEKFESGYGRLLRFEMSVQHLLDIVRIRFGDELILSHGSGPEIQSAYKSITSSLSKLLYMMLKYSLSSNKTISQGEHDIAAVVAALSDCQLGSIGCHAILMALRKLLVYCEVFPIPDGKSHKGASDADIICNILDGNGIKRSKNRNREADLKLKRIKSDMVGRLARNLLIGQFHEVIAPLLLSRSIFDGRRGASNVVVSEVKRNKTRQETTIIENQVETEYHWQNDWRLVLNFFIWLTSIAGPGGAKAAQETGNLLLQSGKAGSLNECLVTKDRMSLLRVIVPPFPSPTSAVPPGSYYDPSRDIMEIHMTDLCNRLKITVYMIGGITASLLSAKLGVDESRSMGKDAMHTLAALIDAVVKITLHLLASNHSITDNSVVDGRFQRRAVSSVMDKPDVKIAIELAPPLVTAAVLFEDKIRGTRCKNYNSDSDSWDLLENNIDSGSSEDIVLDAQIGILSQSTSKLIELVGVLITRAMIVGGGEASTIVWRNVIAAFDSGSSSKLSTDVEENKVREGVGEASPPSNTQVSSFISNNLLCRLTSTVFNLIVQRRLPHGPNPWNSIELCSATARLCDLVEEKKLLQVPFEYVRSDAMFPKSKHENFTLDQVRLLCALLQVMESGRENTGWCQLDLPNPPTRLDATEGQNQLESLQKFYPSLVDAFDAKGHNHSSETANFVDFELLSEKDEIYHVQLGGNHPAVSLGAGDVSAKQTNPGSASSSRMLLPILQPSLRIILSCLESVKGVAVVVRERMGEETGKETDSLHSILVSELSSTITAAIVGLTFPNARDVCLNTLSILRQCMKKIQEDSVAVKYCSLFVTTINEMQVRYIAEQRKREITQNQAYIGVAGNLQNDASNGLIQQNEAVNGDIVETLLMGNTLLHTLGWNNFEGFGDALKDCCQEKNTNYNIKDKVKVAISDLSKYLDEWDERQVKEDEESELVELFDTKATLGNRFDTYLRVNISSYASAADSMTSFIELASTESNRRSEIQSTLFPSRRYNCLSFAEKLAWKAFMEIFYIERMNVQIFERCMADGGRDYGARLISIPIHPQFSRTIPRQLDNSLFTSTSGEINDDEIDLDGLNRLVQKGSLKILDITKKQENDGLNIEEDSMDGSGNVLVSKPSIDSEEIALLEDFGKDPDELYLGFPDDTAEESGSSQIRNDEHQNVAKDGGHEEALSPSDGPQDDLQHDFCMSTFANPPNTSSSSLHGNSGVQNIHASAFGNHGAIDLHYDSVLHIKAEGSRNGTLFLTPTHLILEYEDGLYEGETLLLEELKKKAECDENINDSRRSQLIQHYTKIAAMRPKSVRWNLSELSHVYLRRYRLRDSSLEMFFIPSGGNPTDGPGLASAMSSILLDFGPGERRDEAANAIMARAPPSTVKQWPEKSAHFLHEHLRNITIGWVKGRVSNFDYLMSLNCLSGRSFNDLCQYPVFPWVLSNYTSEEIPDLSDESNYRDLTKPMGALNPQRLEEFLERFETFDDPVIPPFMYGSHYSTSAGVVLHFLVRMHPFASLHRQLQGGHFDVADRLFSSVPRTWDMCTGQSAAEVKELTPEWYCNPSFLRNQNNFKLGASQDGEVLGDVELPPWAKGSPDKFVEVMRCALESDVCTNMLPEWIDLIFGRKQQGPEAVEANNVFFYLTYYGCCDVARIEDDDLRKATELQIAHFGQCPMQLFWRPHVKKLPRSNMRRRLSLSEMLGVYDLDMLKIHSNKNRQLPFASAPISHWVHLFAPPPGPHAPLITLRLVFPDRCVAVDAQGIFHFFRWAWRANMDEKEQDRPGQYGEYDLFTDSGYFVAQRELPAFRVVPRLRHAFPKPPGYAWTEKRDYAVVAISKCLFASQSLLVISDGDGKGGIGFQLLDPSKGMVQGDVCISSVHASRITAIHMDPIGTAAGVGGAGGELAIIGSDDGTATVWRFIANASCHLPLRPRLRFGGHQGNRIHAVAVNSSLNICATVSDVRCCIFNMSSGNMVRSIAPPVEDLSGFSGQDASTIEYETRFVSSNAICINNSGFIVLVCVSKFRSIESTNHREIVSLQLFSLEGVHVGSKALEAWRGIPNKITSTNDGRAIMVCSGRGISIHLISAIKPLHFIDEWQIGGDDDAVTAAHDIDFGPSPSRPIVACTGLSSGALRIHALKGISEWSEENKKGTMTEAVGSVLGTVKGTGSKMVGLVKGTVGLGTELGGETVRGMRMKGVTGFLGDVFGKKIDP